MTPGRDPIAAPRKLLLISYHVPPDALIGGVRTAKFAKYLERLGWKPYVLTIHEKYAPFLDQSKLASVSHLPVVRTAV